MTGRPVVAVALAFCGGVALGAWLPQQPAAWGAAAMTTLGLWCVLLASGRLVAGNRIGLALFVVTGVFRLQADLVPLYAGLDPPAEGDAAAHGRVARAVESSDGAIVAHLEGARLRRGGKTVGLEVPLQVLVSGGDADFAVGDLITVRGNLRLIRGDRNTGWFPAPLANGSTRYAARLVAPSAAWVRRDGHDPGRGPAAVVLRWRAAAAAFWGGRPGAAGQILNSLTTGERAGIPAAVQADFLRSGLTHLLAISGMNVGFLAALIFLLLRRLLALLECFALRFPAQPAAAVLTLPSLWFFMLFSGSQIPVGRAVLSSAAGLAAVILWRRVRIEDAWALAGLCIVAANPRALFSASFQLSFTAVAALMLVASRLVQSASPPARSDDGRLKRLWSGARAIFVISLAASSLTAPVVAFHFQQVSLVGPLANLIAVPFTGFVVLPAAWLSLVAAAAWPPAGALVAAAAAWSAERLVDVATWFALPSWAIVDTARPSPLLTLALLALAGTLVPLPNRRLKLWCVGCCAAAAVAAGGWAAVTHRRQLLVVVLDVGQGLAAAAVMPGGRTLLYDAGPRWRDYDAGERIVVPALRRLGVTHLETLALSHPHPDHNGGEAAVRRELGVGQVWRGGGAAGFVRGEELSPGGGVGAVVLNPRTPTPVGSRASETNDRSLVLLLSWGETGVLLSGDIGPAATVDLAAAAARLPAHIALLVPHHGSSPEACRTLCAGLRPEAAVISVGRNTYGHPRPGAVAALETSARVLRTDRDGAVFIRSDRHRLEIRTWRELSTARTWTERVRWLVAGV